TADNVIEGLVMTIVDIDRTKQAEEALRKIIENPSPSEDVMDSIVEDLPFGIVVARNPHGVIHSVSRRFRELTGRRAETILGKPVEKHVEAFDMFRADGVTRPRPDELPLSRAALKGESVRNETWVIARHGGAHVPIRCTAVPVRARDGSIAGAILGWEEVSETKTENRV